MQKLLALCGGVGYLATHCSMISSGSFSKAAPLVPAGISITESEVRVLEILKGAPTGVDSHVVAEECLAYDPLRAESVREVSGSEDLHKQRSRLLQRKALVLRANQR